MFKMDSAALDRALGAIEPRALLLALATFAIGTDAFIIAGILPQIASDMKCDIGMAGLVVSVFSVSYAIGSPLISAVSTRLSRQLVLSGGLTVFAVANILSAVSPTLPLMLITRVLAALAAGLVAPACYTIAADLGREQDRGKNLAVIGAGFTSAMVLGVPLGIVIGHASNWRGSLGFVALLGLLAGAALLKAGVPEPRQAQAPTSLADQVRVIGNRKTIFVLTPFLIWSAATFGLYTYIGALLGQHLQSSTVPVLLLVFGVGGMFGNFLGGALSDRFGVRWPTLLLVIVLIAALASVRFTAAGLLSAGLNMLVWATSMAGLFTLQQQRVIRVAPNQSNLILALNNSALYLGASIGSAVNGAAISRIALTAAPSVSAGMAVLALVLLVALPQPATARARGEVVKESPRDRFMSIGDDFLADSAVDMGEP
jgi:MFS transporter, DHA1 family, inner membrane transport protein